jgi:hypothetical protein
MEIDMATLKQLSADRVGVLLGGMALLVLFGISAPLFAQDIGQKSMPSTAKSGPSSIERSVDSSSADSSSVNSSKDLPDAPVPATLLATNGDPSALQAGESSSAQDQSKQQQDKQQQNKQQTPQTPPDMLTLGDLGLTPEQIAGNKHQQELLDKRTQMLKMHQRLGLITVIPVAAACISSVGAPPGHGNNGNTTSRDVHVAIGGVAVAMYAATALYAIRAPKVTDEPARGGIKLHKYLIYIHAPGMVLTPILGAIAFNQINSGQKVHGIASAHGAVAVATAATYGAAIIAVSWPIHFKF